MYYRDNKPFLSQDSLSLLQLSRLRSFANGHLNQDVDYRQAAFCFAYLFSVYYCVEFSRCEWASKRCDALVTGYEGPSIIDFDLILMAAANDKQSESPPNIDRAMEADLESPSFGATGSNDYFEQARHRLSVMESSSTCKRAATIKLLDTCENLQTGTHDEDLESVQNLYAAHLAICELEGAARKLPQPCRLPLLSSSDGLALVLDGEGKARLRDCISALHSKSQSWTSYSNNRRDAYVWCKVMRPGFDQGMRG